MTHRRDRRRRTPRSAASSRRATIAAADATGYRVAGIDIDVCVVPVRRRRRSTADEFILFALSKGRMGVGVPGDKAGKQPLIFSAIRHDDRPPRRQPPA